MKTPGEFLCRLVDDKVVVERADDEIWCTAELLELADAQYIVRDGNFVTFTASNGKWKYEITGYRMDARAYEMRLVDRELFR